MPMEDRTIGRVFTAPNGKTYRPSMFVTLTLPSYGPSYGRVTPEGVPVDPEGYDYRRAALDALHFPKLVDRFWQNLRRCAGYRVQYFATVEAQRRLAPHLHAAMRGTIPRRIVREVRAATYHQVWWPAHDSLVYVEHLPQWSNEIGGYLDPTTGGVLPTWDQALDALDTDDEAEPAHVVRFGAQDDLQGLLAGSPGADRAIGYLCKYLPKDIATTYDDGDASPARAAQTDRLAEEVRWLPCAPTCANWLRFGVQPKDPEPGMVPGHCKHKAHDRANLGLGGRRVLVSRQWSGKSLAVHRADRAAVVRAALEEAGVDPDDELSISGTDGRWSWDLLGRSGSMTGPTRSPSRRRSPPASGGGPSTRRPRRRPQLGRAQRRRPAMPCVRTLSDRARESGHEQGHWQAADRPPGRRASRNLGAVPAPPDRGAADHLRAGRAPRPYPREWH